MDYEGVYEDLRTICRRADIRTLEALDNDATEQAQRIHQFEKECWDFRNELYLRGYGH